MAQQHRMPGPPANSLLVIGRQTNVRTLLVTVLSQAGYRVVGCATEAAAALLQKHGAPALILVDGEAASEGFLSLRLQEVAQFLPPRASCPILLLSSAHPPPRPEQLPGTVTVLAQPFNLHEVLHLVTPDAGAPQLPCP